MTGERPASAGWFWDKRALGFALLRRSNVESNELMEKGQRAKIDSAENYVDPFARVFSSREALTQVDGQYFVGDGGPPMLTAIRLSFAETAIMLVAQDDDSIEVIVTGSFECGPECEVRNLNEVAPWKDAIGRPLLWAWRMTNQQGYFDGLQFDFAKTVESPVTRIQLLVAATEFKLQPD